MSYSTISSGVTSGLTLTSGNFVYVVSGGTALSTTIEFGAYLGVDGGIASDTTLASGGEQFVLNGSAYNTIVDSGGSEIVYGGIDSGTVVNSGGYEEVYNGATGSATTLSAGASEEVIGSAAGTIVESGALLFALGLVGSGIAGVVTDASVASGGTIVVLPGGALSDSSLASGAVVVSTGVIEWTPTGDIVSTSVSGLTAGAQNTVFVLPGGVATDITVTSGGYELVSGGTLISSTLDAGGIIGIGSGATVSDSTVSGGYESINSGAIISGLTVEGTGAVYLYSGITVDGAAISAGGGLYVEDDATMIGATVNSGGTLHLLAGEPYFHLLSGIASDTSVGLGGTIDFAYLGFTSGATASVDDSDVLTVVDGDATVTTQLAGDYANESFAVTSGNDFFPQSGPDAGEYGPSLMVTAIPCYCRNTNILTDRGELPIQDLRIGDRLITRSGAPRPLRWIGHRAYDGRFAAANRDVLPILIRRGALTDNVPTQDLYVSPLHAMFVDGALIPARALVNGGSIVQIKAVDTLEYFHLELDSHDVIFAEGAPAESYLDHQNRNMFANAAEYRARHPELVTEIAEYCAPRLEDGPIVNAVHTRLAHRSLAIGYRPPNSMTVSLAAGRNRVEIPPTIGELRLISPSGSAPGDQRQLGALLARISLDGTPLDLTDSRLASGFHRVEKHGEHKVRWTDGAAVLTLDPSSAPRLCEIDVQALMSGTGRAVAV